MVIGQLSVCPFEACRSGGVLAAVVAGSSFVTSFCARAHGGEDAAAPGAARNSEHPRFVLELLDLAARAHEQRTGSRVRLPEVEAAANLSAPEKIVIFRFVQEALNNAFRHAAGKDQAVEVGTRDGRLFVQVSDGGPGFDAAELRGDGLGLAGMKERVESIGGRFDLDASPAGTRVSISLAAEEVEPT